MLPRLAFCSALAVAPAIGGAQATATERAAARPVLEAGRRTVRITVLPLPHHHYRSCSAGGPASV
jgi:hypothetical protein